MMTVTCYGYRGNTKYITYKLFGSTGKSVIIEIRDEGNQINLEKVDFGEGLVKYVKSKHGEMKQFLNDIIEEPCTEFKDRTELLKYLLGYFKPDETKWFMIEENEEELNVQFDDGPTDSYIFVKSRLEQKKLRAALLRQGTSHECAICGEYFPVDFLIAAHIKPRSKTDESERKNVFIVVPMCSFGCDALYEKGWVGVVEGKVVRLLKDKTDSVVEKKIVDLVGRTTKYQDAERIKYFRWHFLFHSTNRNSASFNNL